MSKFLAYCFLIFLTVALGVCVMIFGWGLTPASWLWIIGGGFFGNVIIMTLRLALDRE